MTTDADAARQDPATEQSAHPDGAEATPGEQSGESPPWRAMIAVSQLAAHPGNVRADLDLNEEFVHSVAVNGVLTALRITPDAEGFRVIDGGRRLAAALKTGTKEVPYDLVPERAGDEAGQYLDMINTNRHRNPLTVLEEAGALFAAHQAGARKTRLRKAAGLTAAAVNDALAAAQLSEDIRAKVGHLVQQLTLDQYALLAEFEDDPAAVDRLASAAQWGMSLDHEAERLRQERAEIAEHQRIRAELEGAGVTVTATLPANGQLLTSLCHDDQILTPETHAACPGRGAFFRPYDLASPVHYCTDPAAYGHAFRYATASAAPGGDLGTPIRVDPRPPKRHRIRQGGSSSRATKPGPLPPRSAGGGWRHCSPGGPHRARSPSSSPGSC